MKEDLNISKELVKNFILNLEQMHFYSILFLLKKEGEPLKLTKNTTWFWKSLVRLIVYLFQLYYNKYNLKADWEIIWGINFFKYRSVLSWLNFRKYDIYSNIFKHFFFHLNNYFIYLIKLFFMHLKFFIIIFSSQKMQIKFENLSIIDTKIYHQNFNK